MAQENKKERPEGVIQQIIGAVLDIRFPAGSLPSLYNAVEIPRQDGSVLVAEVSQHPGDDVVRCISMGSTDGLVRGMKAYDTGSAISVPGRFTGRALRLLSSLQRWRSWKRESK